MKFFKLSAAITLSLCFISSVNLCASQNWQEAQRQQQQNRDNQAMAALRSAQATNTTVPHYLITSATSAIIGAHNSSVKK